jgi:hypothetical protein
LLRLEEQQPITQLCLDAGGVILAADQDRRLDVPVADRAGERVAVDDLVSRAGRAVQ